MHVIIIGNGFGLNPGFATAGYTEAFELLKQELYYKGDNDRDPINDRLIELTNNNPA
jgi:hypothetical protein